MGRRTLSYVLVYVLLFAALLMVIALLVSHSTTTSAEVPLSKVVAEAQAGNVSRVDVQGDTLTVYLKAQQSPLTSRIESGTSFETLLHDNDVPVGTGANAVELTVHGSSALGSVFGALLTWLPFILFGGILLYMMRQSGGAGSQMTSFGKSRARLLAGQRPTVTFLDVAGQEEAKQELEEVVEFLKYPEKFAALGARIPHGVLLIGPPGTGKTMMARAVSGEARVPFFSISGSEFVEMFVGVGASRVRDLFDQAKHHAPAIIFIDEIDAVGRQRGAGLGGSHDEREQTLNQILVEMDGFDTSANVIVIAATNRPDILDPALLRPGRFDRQVTLDLPDVKGRRAVLDVHVKGKPLAGDVSLETVAKQTPGFSGADLANLVNESAILAARADKKRIGMDEMNEAIDRVIAGPERKSRVITPAEKRVVAYHEAGHAVAGYFTPQADPPFKVTIVSRGMAGGFTRMLPEEERHLEPRSYYIAMMVYSLGGHVAEELVFGDLTTGAHDDIGKVTQIARDMVTQWGMSDRLGPRTFGKRDSMIFLGRDIAEQRDYSEHMAEEIDLEVRHLVDQAHERCRAVLREHRDVLDRLANTLIEVETLEGDDLLRVLGPAPGRPAPPEEVPVGPGAPPATPPVGPASERRPPPAQGKPGIAWGHGNATPGA